MWPRAVWEIGAIGSGAGTVTRRYPADSDWLGAILDNPVRLRAEPLTRGGGFDGLLPSAARPLVSRECRDPGNLFMGVKVANHDTRGVGSHARYLDRRPRDSFSGDDMGLVVRRHKGESVRIGKNIRITILSLGDRAVRLDIEAPPETTIARDELGEWIKTPEPTPEDYKE